MSPQQSKRPGEIAVEHPQASDAWSLLWVRGLDCLDSTPFLDMKTARSAFMTNPGT
ncbi:hypothetical protein [Halochromatium roseum]|uniref:hypothetical protein n=1 Tax=Halochromatium roseum TaxID=391920 RepID=UPI001914353F|nr:hypothetical protein [Halochromatium roseum]